MFKMHVKNTILTATAALSAGVAADFLVITDYPQALQTLSPEQGEAWLSSNLPALQSEFVSLATDPSYLAQATAVIPALREFAATATASIPPAVTALDQFTIFTTVPSWYTDLPSGVKSFYDNAAGVVERFLVQTVTVSTNGTSATPTMGSPTSKAFPTVYLSTVPQSLGGPVTSTGSATGSASPENTGAAGKVQAGAGVAVAAGLAGLLAL